MNQLRGAVIGVGYLGHFHAQKIKGSEQALLVGVFDQFTPQAEKVATALGVKAFKTLEQICI